MLNDRCFVSLFLSMSVVVEFYVMFAVASWPAGNFFRFVRSKHTWRIFLHASEKFRRRPIYLRWRGKNYSQLVSRVLQRRQRKLWCKRDIRKTQIKQTFLYTVIITKWDYFTLITTNILSLVLPLHFCTMLYTVLRPIFLENTFPRQQNSIQASASKLSRFQRRCKPIPRSWIKWLSRWRRLCIILPVFKKRLKGRFKTSSLTHVLTLMQPLDEPVLAG